MKMSTATIAATLMLSAATAGAFDTDYYIPNPGFTDGVNGQVPPGWAEGYGATNGCVRSTDCCHSAPASMRIEGNFAKAVVRRLPRNVPVTLGGWLKVDRANMRTQFGVEFVNFSPSWTTVGWVDIMNVSGPALAWTYYSKTFIIPDTIQGVYLNVYNKGDALYWLDDIVISVHDNTAVTAPDAPLRVAAPADVPSMRMIVGLDGRALPVRFCLQSCLHRSLTASWLYLGSGEKNGEGLRVIPLP